MEKRMVWAVNPADRERNSRNPVTAPTKSRAAEAAIHFRVCRRPPWARTGCCTALDINFHAFTAKQIGLGLPSVPQNRQPMGILGEFVGKIADYGSAGLADLGTYYIGEAEDPALHREEIMK